MNGVKKSGVKKKLLKQKNFAIPHQIRLSNEETPELVPLDIKQIQLLVANEVKKAPKTLEDLERYLVNWWCRYYKKPYKCEEVKDYTLEELLYEYFDIFYRSSPEELDKFLNEESVDSSEDEDWLKKQMGGGYLSKKEQEKVLKEAAKDVEFPSEGKLVDEITEGFHMDFEK